MDFSDLFKRPAAPVAKSGEGNKRKLPEHPDAVYAKESRHQTYEEITGREDVSDVGRRAKAARTDDGLAATAAVSREEDVVDFGAEQDEEGGRFFGDGLTDDHRRILELVDAAEDLQTETLDVPGVKRMLLRFEKALSRNTELRVKYAHDPTKFMESEADLDEEIKALMSLTQAPQHYPTIVQLNCDASIVSLLSHENTDIAVGAVELLKELTDEDVLPEDEEGEKAVRAFVDSLVNNQVLELLEQNMQRLDESVPADYEGVFNSLGVVENLTSFEPKLAETIVERTEMLAWLLRRLQGKPFDSNKQYASEILSILLQTSRSNRLKLLRLGGIDILLQVLFPYRRKDPNDDDEVEFLENLFDALCSILGEPEGKEQFVKAEGIELMLIMLKEKKLSRMRAFKVLDFACSTTAGVACCERLVDSLGLKTVFAALMGKGAKKLKKQYKSFSESEQDEHVIGLVGSLLRNLPHNSERRRRLLAKFTENEHEKVDRLLELREALSARVADADLAIARRTAAQDDRGLEDEDAEEDDYLTRLEHGLFALQAVDLTLAAVAVEADSVREHAQMQLKRRNKSLDTVKATLQEYIKNLGAEEQIPLAGNGIGEGEGSDKIPSSEHLRVQNIIMHL